MQSIRVALGVVAMVSVAGCSDPSALVTVTNRTGQTIRLTGSCVADDPHTLDPGETDTGLYLGADCRVDNGDGVTGMLACITLNTAHTDITVGALRNPPGPGQCWGSGTRQ